MEEVERCEECGKVLKDKSYEPYCKQCDEKLDKQFDGIEDNILIYRELLDSEIKVLEKFEDTDIKDLFKRVYEKLSREEGGLKKESIVVLNKLKRSFSLKESELGIGKLPEIKEIKKSKPKDQCPECDKKIKEDFNLCPYCGYRLKDDFVSKF
ncbi:MAG: zinc ribbon domain-containing protein [Actinobacteria bacterium]|uniref:Putative zinc-ribbon domain-containing protein n=1 Tax=marine sediment metagenome TaxID=412755 RepID=X0YW40_9ZZZZ|nr:MAG: zinc ribbon domain-containing protein [Actinomycetota bacterium]